jgi:hypothetical protein
VWCMFLVKDKKKASLRQVEWEVSATTKINRWAMFLFYISFILFFSLWCAGWWAHEHMEKDLAWYVRVRLQISIIQAWMKIVMLDNPERIPLNNVDFTNFNMDLLLINWTWDLGQKAGTASTSVWSATY